MSEFSTRQDDDDVTAQYQKLKIWARENYTHEEVIHMFAKARVEADLYKSMAAGQRAFITKSQSHSKEIERLRAEHQKFKALSYEKVAIQGVKQGLNIGAKFMADKSKKEATERGKAAAEIRHDKPGQSRDKKYAIQAIWATGKYTSRDLCADQECAALNMAPGTARRALRNTPKPA